MFNKDKLVKLMEERDLNLTDVSRLCGIAYSTLRDLYTGKNKNPLANTLTKMAQGLEVDADYFIYDDIDVPQEKIKSLPMIPSHFTDVVEARMFLKSFAIFGSNGFTPDKLSDEEVLQFTNELLEHMDTMKYKYKK